MENLRNLTAIDGIFARKSIFIARINIYNQKDLWYQRNFAQIIAIKRKSW